MARVQISASPGELREKALPLARQLVAGLATHDSRLEKALASLDDLHEGTSPIDASPVMARLIARASAIYAEEMVALADDIERELEEPWSS